MLLLLLPSTKLFVHKQTNAKLERRRGWRGRGWRSRACPGDAVKAANGHRRRWRRSGGCRGCCTTTKALSRHGRGRGRCGGRWGCCTGAATKTTCWHGWRRRWRWGRSRNPSQGGVARLHLHGRVAKLEGILVDVGRPRVGLEAGRAAIEVTQGAAGVVAVKLALTVALAKTIVRLARSTSHGCINVIIIAWWCSGWREERGGVSFGQISSEKQEKEQTGRLERPHARA